MADGNVKVEVELKDVLPNLVPCGLAIVRATYPSRQEIEMTVHVLPQYGADVARVFGVFGIGGGFPVYLDVKAERPKAEALMRPAIEHAIEEFGLTISDERRVCLAELIAHMLTARGIMR